MCMAGQTQTAVENRKLPCCCLFPLAWPSSSSTGMYVGVWLRVTRGQYTVRGGHRGWLLAPPLHCIGKGDRTQWQVGPP